MTLPKIDWTIVGVVAAWLVSWGFMQSQVSGHDKDLAEIKRDFVTAKELGAIDRRLGRIEGSLDELNRYFRRPQQ